MNVAMAVASGGSVLGKRVVDPGPVVYVLEEGSKPGVAKRFESMLPAYRPVHDFQMVFRQQVLLRDPERWARVRATVALAQGQARHH
jgi:hypothetical protein